MAKRKEFMKNATNNLLKNVKATMNMWKKLIKGFLMSMKKR